MGMKKPRPSTPTSMIFEVLTPTTLPWSSSRGPPLFPREIAASDWMNVKPDFSRIRLALTMPLVTVASRASDLGLPTA